MQKGAQAARELQQTWATPDLDNSSNNVLTLKDPRVLQIET